MKKKTLHDFKKMKKDGEIISFITAYDYPIAKAAQNAGIDMILVGDSGGMVQYGYETTNPVTMEESLMMVKAVKRGADKTFVVGDMPQGSYEVSNEVAIKNAIEFVKNGCDAVKLEGGKRSAERVQAIVNAGVLVMGHLGLTPQSTSVFGGYRIQGKTPQEISYINDDINDLLNAGVFAILLEALPNGVGEELKNKNDYCLTLGIGAGENVDGQLIIAHDLLGFYDKFRPKFAKCYINQILTKFVMVSCKETREDGFLKLAEMAIKEYIKEVKDKTFPGKEYSYEKNTDNRS